VITWTALLQLTRGCFGAPSFALFSTLLAGWVCAPGRRTITAMIAVADPHGRRSHDAYHRFLRDGTWLITGLWRVLATHAVASFAPSGVVNLDVDDTLFHKTGRRIDGAGTFRDAMRSTVSRVVYARGLNLVVVTLRVYPPWGGVPIGLPINARLHRKNDTLSTVDHAVAMVEQLAAWLPERSFHICADGGYASLCGKHLPRSVITTRIRRDAALYQLPPPHKGTPGRPKLKGDKLPTPAQLATAAGPGQWQTTPIDLRGHRVAQLIYVVRDVLWYEVTKRDPVVVVIVRDPTGTEPDNYFISTDPTATGAQIASHYTGRWSIEVTFRDVKQDLGGEDPQSWKRHGPQRAACLSLWLHGLTWCWYLHTHPTGRTWTPRPWYQAKRTPSFLDALAALRRILWAQRISDLSNPTADHHKTTQALLDALAYAA
jgi:hypothetical protein